MIILGTKFLEVIKWQGQHEYPYECCGALLGTVGTDSKKTVSIALPISNNRNDNEKHNRYTISPEEMLRCEREAEKAGVEIIGFYHSHPDHPAEPSEYDREHAWPFYSYVIVSVYGGKVKDINSWELDGGREKFNREDITEGD